jgi:hypothetical protein
MENKKKGAIGSLSSEGRKLRIDGVRSGLGGSWLASALTVAGQRRNRRFGVRRTGLRRSVATSYKG